MDSIINLEQLKEKYLPELGKICTENGHNEDEVIDAFTEMLDNPVDIVLLSRITMRIAECFSKEYHFEEAKELGLQAIKQAISSDSFPKVTLYNLHTDLGDILLQSKEYYQAVMYYRDAMSTLNMVEASNSEDVKYASAELYYKIGRCYCKIIFAGKGHNYDADMALESFRSAKELLGSYSGEENTINILNRINEYVHDLYEILCDNNNKHIDESWAEDALAYFKQMIHKLHSDDDEVISSTELDYHKRILNVLFYLHKNEEFEQYNLYYKGLEESFADYWRNKGIKM